MAPLIAGRPHANTVSDRIANGIHALRIWPAVYLRAGVAPAGAAAASPSNLQTRFGRQNRRKTTVASSETTPPAMSTRFESTWLDQRYCVTLNDTPTTRMAGRTSNVSAQPTIARTSQKGTMMPVIGRMRPIMALRSDSGRPETAASVCTGVPMAPQATGDVLAIRLSAAAWNGRKPRPIMKAPAIATGAPNPAAPSMQAPVGRDARHRLLHDLELAGEDGNVVEVDRRQNDPGDFQHAEADAVQKTHPRERERHPKDAGRDQDRCPGPGNRAPVRLHP